MVTNLGSLQLFEFKVPQNWGISGAIFKTTGLEVV